jgi:hypothetical protein
MHQSVGYQFISILNTTFSTMLHIFLLRINFFHKKLFCFIGYLLARLKFLYFLGGSFPVKKHAVLNDFNNASFLQKPVSKEYNVMQLPHLYSTAEYQVVFNILIKIFFVLFAISYFNEQNFI